MKQLMMKRKSTLMMRGKDSLMVGRDPKALEEKLFADLLLALQKATRTSSDNLLLQNYLNTMEELVELVKQSSDNHTALFANISNVIKYKNVETNRILFKVGDDGEKFYFILKGKVCVLVPQCERIEMSEDEYLAYLAKLRRAEEFELLDRCKYMNSAIFNIEEENFDKYLAKFYSNRKNTVFNDNSDKNFVSINEDIKLESRQIIEEISQEMKITLTYIEKKLLLSDKPNFKIMKNSNVNKEDIWYDTSQMYPYVSSPDEYIRNTMPVVYSQKSPVERKLVSVWKYCNVKMLNRGDKFGELALHAISGKRTATLVTCDDCHFGLLDKASYDQCLRELYEKLKKGNINMLISTPVFDDYNKVLFVKHIFNFFQ